jgi:hypothetical protein
MPPRIRRPLNSWQRFMHAHSGEGLSSTEIAALYTRTTDAPRRKSSKTRARIPKVIVYSNGVCGKKRKLSSWQKFMRSQKGEGFSSSELSSMYQKL